MVRRLLPDIAGTIIYKYNPSLGQLVIWLADASFYMPPKDSSPTVDMVVPVGKNNLVQASLGKVYFPTDNSYLSKSDVFNLSSKPVQFLGITGNVCYLVITSNLNEFLLAKDLQSSSSQFSANGQDILLSGIDWGLWSIFKDA